jgi:hypothetical protein
MATICSSVSTTVAAYAGIALTPRAAPVTADRRSPPRTEAGRMRSSAGSERRGLMGKIVAGAFIATGECGEDDVTSANLEQMAATLATRPLTDAERRELVEMLRWLAKVVREMEATSPDSATASRPTDEPSPA